MAKLSIGRVEFRISPIVPKGTLTLIDTKHFPLIEQYRYIAFVDSEESFLAIMREPAEFLKLFNQMRSQDCG